MRGRLLIVITIAVIAAAGVAGLAMVAGEGEDGGGGGRWSEQLPDEYYGISGHVLRMMAGEGELGRLDRHLAAIERLGPSFVRANLDWLQLEPAAPQGDRRSYDFHSHDDWVRLLARHRLRWYVIGVGTPGWAASPGAVLAGCGIFSPPADPGDFAELMAAIARRYGRGGSFWAEHPKLPRRPVVDYEVWNEPNLGGFWCPHPDPAAYAELVAAASAAIRAVDPDARVVLGGLAPFAESSPPGGRRSRIAVEEFLEGVRDSRTALPELIDVVGIHAYGRPGTVLDQVAWYREAADGVGLGGLPLSLNETGWTTRGEGGFAPTPEPARARYLARVSRRVAAGAADCDVTSFAPHTWVTEERDPADQEHWFGIAEPASGRPYASARAYARTIRERPPGDPVPEPERIPLCGG